MRQRLGLKMRQADTAVDRGIEDINRLIHGGLLRADWWVSSDVVVSGELAGRRWCARGPGWAGRWGVHGSLAPVARRGEAFR